MIVHDQNACHGYPLASRCRICIAASRIARDASWQPKRAGPGGWSRSSCRQMSTKASNTSAQCRERRWDSWASSCCVGGDRLGITHVLWCCYCLSTPGDPRPFVDKPRRSGQFVGMDYTQLFRSLREAKGLTLDKLAAQARCHRNTVTNVEAGRPVKFKTIARLMLRMGYSADSREMKSMALLWLEAVSGIPFSRPETKSSAERALAQLQSGVRTQFRLLEQAVGRSSLDADQVSLLVFAASTPEVLRILESVRELVGSSAGGHQSLGELKVAEDS